jgi:ATP-dependent DNA ligase
MRPADPLRSLPKTTAAFVEPMDCLPIAKLPDGSHWIWEIKLDGYRAVAVKSGGSVTLHSRNRKILNKRFPYIVEKLRNLPDGTVVDGEIVALEDDGRPVFNLLQNLTRVSPHPLFRLRSSLLQEPQSCPATTGRRYRETTRQHVRTRQA